MTEKTLLSDSRPPTIKDVAASSDSKIQNITVVLFIIIFLSCFSYPLGQCDPILNRGKKKEQVLADGPVLSSI